VDVRAGFYPKKERKEKCSIKLFRIFVKKKKLFRIKRFNASILSRLERPILSLIKLGRNIFVQFFSKVSLDVALKKS
jgi:hypothetical protein